MASLKDLKVKTGVCKRTLKEFQSYESEEKREAAKTQSMRDSNADPYDLKQQVTYRINKTHQTHLGLLAIDVCFSFS